MRGETRIAKIACADGPPARVNTSRYRRRLIRTRALYFSLVPTEPKLETQGRMFAIAWRCGRLQGANVRPALMNGGSAAMAARRALRDAGARPSRAWSKFFTADRACPAPPRGERRNPPPVSLGFAGLATPLRSHKILRLGMGISGRLAGQSGLRRAADIREGPR